MLKLQCFRSTVAVKKKKLIFRIRRIIGVHSSRGLGGGGQTLWEKVPLRVEPERPLDEGTEWVVGRSTETVDSSPSTESMDSWAAAPWTESVDFSLS